jgi:hypothetical protein
MMNEYLNTFKDVISRLQTKAREMGSLEMSSLVAELTNLYVDLNLNHNLDDYKTKVNNVLDKIIMVDANLKPICDSLGEQEIEELYIIGKEEENNDLDIYGDSPESDGDEPDLVIVGDNESDDDWIYHLGNVEGGDADDLCEKNLRPSMDKLVGLISKLTGYITIQATHYSAGLDIITRFTEINGVKQIYFTLSSVPIYTCTSNGDNLPELLDMMFVLFYVLNEIDERIVRKNMVSTVGILDVVYENIFLRRDKKKEVFDILNSLFESLKNMSDNPYESKESSKQHRKECDSQSDLLLKYIELQEYFIDPKQNDTCIKNLIRLSRAINNDNHDAIDHIKGTYGDQINNINLLIKQVINYFP